MQKIAVSDLIWFYHLQPIDENVQVVGSQLFYEIHNWTCQPSNQNSPIFPANINLHQYAFICSVKKNEKTKTEYFVLIKCCEVNFTDFDN